MIIDSPIISGSTAASGSLNQVGNITITGSLTVTGNITGNITGSATNAVSASYAATSTSASYAVNATSASYAVAATSASYAASATSASYAANATSASYANSATSAASSTSASYAASATSASYSNNSTSASYAAAATSASYAAASTSASYSSTATSASYAATATSASLAQNALTASYLSNYIPPFPYTGSAGISGSLVVNGNITAQTLIVQTITSSEDFVTGSTHFGSIIANTHQLTGSVTVSGSLAVNGSTAILTNQTGAMSVATASYVANAVSASFTQTAISASYASAATSASYSNTSTSASYASTATSASLAQNAISASYALTASYASNVPATSSFAVSASIALNAISASYITSSNIVGTVASATSASYALTASFASNVPATSSFAISASQALSASYALTASYASNVPATSSFAVSASQAQNAVSAAYSAYALTSSYSLAGSGFPFSGSAVITGSLLVTNLSSSGVSYLVADSSGFVTAQTASAAIRSTQTVVATAGQTTFNITNGYTTGLVDVFINGTKLNSSEFTDTNGTTIVLVTGSFVNDVVEFEKYFPASGVTNNALRQLTTFTASAAQTVFSASYTPGLLDIFYNGSRLSNNEYTANNGTFFTLATGSVAGDILDVFVYSYQVGAFSGIGGAGVASQVAYFNTTNSITGSPNFTISGSTMTVTGSLIVSGSGTFTNIGPAVFSGSLTSTAGFTGSFSGTATSASFASTASFVANAQTASFVANAQSASYILNAVSSSFATRAVTASYADSLTVTGTLTAQTLVVQTITSSVLYSSGSNVFGNNIANTQTFTGSVLITGSVGIGFPNPTSSLNINGNVSIGANLTSLMLPHGLDTNGRSLIIAGTGSANPNYGVLFLANNTSFEAETLLGGILAAQVITGSKSGVNAATKAAISFFSTGSGGSVGGLGGYITFSTRPNNAANDIGSYERMRIDTNGNIGIGTSIVAEGTQAASSISIFPNSSVSSGPLIQFPANGRIRPADTGNRLSIDGNALFLNSTFSGNIIMATGGGNVGINTTSPANLLHLAGASATPSLRLGSTSTTYYWDIGRENATTGDFIFINANPGSPTERVRITTDGKVGIGTSSPLSTFVVNGNNAGGRGGEISIVNISGTTVGSEAALNFGFGASTYNGDNGNAQIKAVFASGNEATDMVFSSWNGSAYGEKMRISSAGLVGIGTTSPTSPLTVRSTSRGDMLRLSISGSSSAGDATGITFGSATYDKAQIIAYNENTGNAAGYLTFWTGGSPATTDMTERMRLKSDGSVYIGGTSMANAQKFGIIGSGVWGGATIGLQNTGTSGQTYSIFSTDSLFSQGAGNLLFYNTTNPLNNLILYANGNYDFAGSDVSDRRLKQDIENINFGLNEIMALSPKSYHLKSEDNLSGEHQTTLRKRYGFIAQEVQSILPDTITGTETETEYLGLDYNGVLAVAVKAIQEQQALITALEEKLERNNII